MKRALVVDDDDLVRPTVSAMVRDLGFEVIQASGGKDAIPLITQREFDIIITDLFMPEFDGLELILSIREITSDTPVVLMTGGGCLFPHGSDGLENLTDAAEQFGASYLLRKPFRKSDLSKLIDRIFDMPL